MKRAEKPPFLSCFLPHSIVYWKSIECTCGIFLYAGAKLKVNPFRYRKENDHGNHEKDHNGRNARLRPRYRIRSDAVRHALRRLPVLHPRIPRGRMCRPRPQRRRGFRFNSGVPQQQKGVTAHKPKRGQPRLSSFYNFITSSDSV